MEKARAAGLVRRQSPDALASLIFTSGTTGKPKGVMLTHRNFTFMVSELSKIFEFGVTDGMLSVLPLSHTFEFATGLLVPLAHGAQITYLPELTGDAISSALKRGHVTAIVGVPALWDLMRRRLFQRFDDKSPVLGGFMRLLAKANYELRNRAGFDVGNAAFSARARGVRRPHPLPDQRRLGAARGGAGGILGHGLQLLRGLRPDRDGARADGDVAQEEADRRLGGAAAARDRGQDRRARRHDRRGRGDRARPERDGRLLAGRRRDRASDPRRLVPHRRSRAFDDDGNLHLVGRSKDVIVDANGKNVYPDEIEDLYRDSPFIKELSVVGVPDGVGEQVACAVVVDLEHDTSLSAAEVTAKVEEHFRKVSTDLPIWKRVRSLHVWEGDLPKTEKRSIKRREVAAEIARLRRKNEESKGALAAAGEGGQVAWLLDTVATVSGRRRPDVQLGSRFGELGFDSLMYAELSSALDTAGDRAARQRRRHDAGHGRRAAGAARARAGRGGARAGGQAVTRRRRRDPRARGRLGRGQARARLGAARVLPAGAADEGEGRVAHSPAHQLHRRRQPRARTWTWARSRWRWATRAAT